MQKSPKNPSFIGIESPILDGILTSTTIVFFSLYDTRFIDTRFFWFSEMIPGFFGIFLVFPPHFFSRLRREFPSIRIVFAP